MDESGSNTEARYFVLAGLALFERQTFFAAQEVDRLQQEYFPDSTDIIEFHAAPLHVREDDLVPEPFNRLPIAQRRQLLSKMYDIVVTPRRGIVFGVAVEKECLPRDEHPYGRAFEEIVNRFDLFLGRHNRTNQDDLQRGLLVVAESSYRIYLEILAQKIRGQGTRWGETRNLADIPFFTPAKNTRLLQLADFCANAIFGRYESGYTRYFDRICGQVDQEGGRLHGLVHLCKEPYKCYCPACTSRRPAEPLERPLL